MEIKLLAGRIHFDDRPACREAGARANGQGIAYDIEITGPINRQLNRSGPRAPQQATSRRNGDDARHLHYRLMGSVENFRI